MTRKPRNQALKIAEGATLIVLGGIGLALGSHPFIFVVLAGVVSLADTLLR